MIDEATFRKAADEAIADLTEELYATEDEGGFEVDVGGVRHPIDVQLSGFYDPRAERLRA